MVVSTCLHKSPRICDYSHAKLAHISVYPSSMFELFVWLASDPFFTLFSIRKTEKEQEDKNTTPLPPQKNKKIIIITIIINKILEIIKGCTQICYAQFINLDQCCPWLFTSECLIKEQVILVWYIRDWKPFYSWIKLYIPVSKPFNKWYLTFWEEYNCNVKTLLFNFWSDQALFLKARSPKHQWTSHTAMASRYLA